MQHVPSQRKPADVWLLILQVKRLRGAAEDATTVCRLASLLGNEEQAPFPRIGSFKPASKHSTCLRMDVVWSDFRFIGKEGKGTRSPRTFSLSYASWVRPCCAVALLVRAARGRDMRLRVWEKREWRSFSGLTRFQC